MARKASEPTTTENTTRTTKLGMIIDLLRRDDGATLEELCTATGWQPHSTRAVLTGLRKKGHVIDKTKREDASCYRIAGEA